jgi:hypothetical protein
MFCFAARFSPYEIWTSQMHGSNNWHRFRRWEELAKISTLRRACILFYCNKLSQSKSQTLRQNHTVLRRTALSGPERAPDNSRWGRGVGGWNLVSYTYRCRWACSESTQQPPQRPLARTLHQHRHNSNFPGASVLLSLISSEAVKNFRPRHLV